MKNQRIVFFYMVLLPLFETGCRGCEQPKKRHPGVSIDGGGISREECINLDVECGDKCYAREASVSCYDCCTDQGFLCDTQQPYSFAYCDGAR